MEPPLLIHLFKWVLPVLGFHAWDSLLSDRDFFHMSLMLRECTSSDLVNKWAKETLETARPTDKSMRQDYNRASHAAIQLQHAWTNNEAQSPILIQILLQHRASEVQNATHWLRLHRRVMKYEQIHKLDRYVEDALREYKRWKLLKKPDTIQKCIINMTTSFVEEGMSHKEALQKAQRGMDFVDSSEDETHPTFAIRQKMPSWRAVFGSKIHTNCLENPSSPAAELPIDSGAKDRCSEGARTVVQGISPSCVLLPMSPFISKLCILTDTYCPLCCYWIFFFSITWSACQNVLLVISHS